MNVVRPSEEYCLAGQCRHLTRAEKQKAHGTPQEFRRAVIAALGEISIDDANAAIDRYEREWELLPSEACSICAVPYLNGKQRCNCNAGRLQPLCSKERVQTADIEACHAWLIQSRTSIFGSHQIIAMLNELLERRSIETGAGTWTYKGVPSPDRPKWWISGVQTPGHYIATCWEEADAVAICAALNAPKANSPPYAGQPVDCAWCGNLRGNSHADDCKRPSVSESD